MAEAAHTPPPAPGLSGQQDTERLPTQNSSRSTSQDTSLQQPSSVHPSTAPSTAPLVMPSQNPDQTDYGPGLYAVPTYPQFLGIMPGFPPSTLIPLSFQIPTRANSTGSGGEELGQQQGPQRPVVVRRFHFAFQLDLALIIKLAAVVFLFSQEGSRQRFILLLLFASFIYLYQTGVLTPLIRWIRRGGAPQPHPAIHPEQPPLRHVDGNQPRPEGNIQAGNRLNEQPLAAVVNVNPPEAERQNQNQLWGILKEIQMFVIGFITSLLPGFHHHND